MIKFIKSFRNYGAGEVAGFTPTHEQWLIDRRIAEPFLPAREEAPMAKSSGSEKAETPKKEKDPSQPVTRQTTVGPQTRK